MIRIDCDVHPMEGDKKELVLKLHLDSKMERMLKSEINDGKIAHSYGKIAHSYVVCWREHYNDNR